MIPTYIMPSQRTDLSVGTMTDFRPTCDSLLARIEQAYRRRQPGDDIGFELEPLITAALKDVVGEAFRDASRQFDRQWQSTYEHYMRLWNGIRTREKAVAAKEKALGLSS